MEGGEAVFTRKVGWGIEGAGLGGAPFDASALGGMGMGGGIAGRHPQGGMTGGYAHNGAMDMNHGGGVMGSHNQNGVPGAHAGHNSVPGARVAEPAIARRPVGDNIV